MISVLTGPGMLTMPNVSTDWMVQVPLSQLVALQNMSAEMDKLQDENMQLRRRMDGIHATLYQALERLGELQKSL